MIITKELAEKILKAMYSRDDYEFEIKLTGDNEFDYAIKVPDYDCGIFISLVVKQNIEDNGLTAPCNVIKTYAVGKDYCYDYIGTYYSSIHSFGKGADFWKQLYFRQLEATHIANLKKELK